MSTLPANRNRTRRLWGPAIFLAAVCTVTGARASGTAIDAARLVAADTETANWIQHGRTQSEQRYSPLDQIQADNVDQLGLAWHLDLGTQRGLEARRW